MKLTCTEVVFCVSFSRSGEEVPHPSSFEKFVGDLDGAYSRRINIQHRLVYQVLNEDRVVKILRMYQPTKRLVHRKLISDAE